MAFLAGSVVARWPWALAMALLSALMSPKLYGYPKVLITAVAALLIVSCRGLPTWRRVALMSAWTAVAFLFRHDYAVYCAVGFLALIALSGHAVWRDRIGRVAAYGVITLVLLAPSFWWIQHYRGLTEYVRNAREMSANEYERTRIVWPRVALEGSPSATLDNEENSEAWIYYLFLSVPIVVTVITLRRRMRGGAEEDTHAAALVALSLMSAVALALPASRQSRSAVRGHGSTGRSARCVRAVDGDGRSPALATRRWRPARSRLRSWR